MASKAEMITFLSDEEETLIQQYGPNGMLLVFKAIRDLLGFSHTHVAFLSKSDDLVKCVLDVYESQDSDVRRGMILTLVSSQDMWLARTQLLH